MLVWACRRLTKGDFYSRRCFRHTSTGSVWQNYDRHTSTKLSVTIGFKTQCQFELVEDWRKEFQNLCAFYCHTSTGSVWQNYDRHTSTVAQCDKGFKTQCQSELVEDWRMVIFIVGDVFVTLRLAQCDKIMIVTLRQGSVWQRI